MSELSRERVFDGFLKVDRVDTGGKHPFEVVVTTDSVTFLVHNVDKDELMLVQQDRPAMIRDDNPNGTIIEAAAGRFDRNVGVVGLILAELQEELGVTADAIQVNLLNCGFPLALSPGVLTERQYLAIVSIREDQIDPQKRQYGAEGEGESITRTFIPVSELGEQIFEDLKLFALVQFFLRYYVCS